MSAVPGQFNIELDSVVPAQQPELEGYIIAFYPPVHNPHEAIAIIVENGSKLNLNSNEMVVRLQSKDSTQKQVIAWNRATGQVTTVETSGSNFGPSIMLLLERESDALVFRTPTAGDYKMDIPNFWKILGGRIVTFDWMQGQTAQLCPVEPYPQFVKLPHILTYQPATGDITIRKVFHIRSYFPLFLNFAFAPEVWSAKGNKPAGTLSKDLSGLLPPDTPYIPMTSTTKTRS